VERSQTDWILQPVAREDFKAYDLVAAAGRLVAVGRSGYDSDPQGVILNSGYGVNWGRWSSGLAFEFSHAAFGNGLALAAGRGRSSKGEGIAVAFSTNTFTWEVQQLDGQDCVGAEYGNDRFVVVGIPKTPGYLLTSYVTSDGSSWLQTSFEYPYGDSAASMSFREGLFAIENPFWSTGIASTDGIQWFILEGDDGDVITRVAKSESSSVGISERGNLWYRWEEQPWTQVNEKYPSLSGSLRHLNGRFHTASGAGGLWTSGNGRDWRFSPGPEGVVLRDLAYGQGLYVGIGVEKPPPDHPDYPMLRGRILQSQDGINWEVTPLDHPEHRAITYGDGLFVVVGDKGWILTSVDGREWSFTKLVDTWQFFDVVHGDGRFVAVGGSNTGEGITPTFGACTVSVDGLSWAPQFTGNYDALTSVAYGRGIFVAVGGIGSGPIRWSSHIMRSQNGLEWRPPAVASRHALHAVAYGGGVFVAGGGYYSKCSPGADYLVASVDGDHWIEKPTVSKTVVFNGLAYGNNSFMAQGTRGTIQSAPLATLQLSPIPTGLSADSFSLDLDADSGTCVVIEASPDLKNWHPIAETTSWGEPIPVQDPSAKSWSRRFYQAVLREE
jgi:hypothetical protein